MNPTSTPGPVPHPAFRTPHLIGLEWFKLRKRPMPYVLLVVLAAFLATNELLVYLVVRVVPSSTSMTPEARREFIDALVFPDALPSVFANVQNLGSIMLIILTAVSFGGEFGWGTVRLLLSRGAGRAEYIVGKLIALGLWAVLFVAGGALTGLAAATLITLLERRDLGAALSGATFGELPAMAARTWYVLATYLLLTAFVTVATRSTAAGMASALVYYFVEGLAGNILSLFVSGWFGRALRLLIGVNVQGVMEANGQRPGAAGSPFHLPPPGQAALVLAVYAALFLVATIALFRRRDITAGGGQ